MHPRQAIREAVRARLISAATSAGARVYETRMTPFREVELPAIAVYTMDETADDRGSSPRELTRKLTLEIVAAVRAADNVDDALDSISLEIERAMHSDETLGGTASDSVLTSTDIGIEIEGNKPIGMVRINYAVTYYSHAPESADTALGDFKTADIRFSLNNEQAPLDQAHDQLQNLDQE